MIIYRRGSEREDYSTPRQRRDSERLNKISLKKSLSRPESQQERTSPAKTPQPLMGLKTSRKQLFSVDSPVREETVSGHEKSEKRRKKKSSSAEPATSFRRDSVSETPSAPRSQSILPDGFIPRAWHQFQFDKALLLKLACNSVYD